MSAKPNVSSTASTTSGSSNIKNAVRGIVSMYSEHNGYGFITPDDGGEDVFVHSSVCQNEGKEEVETVILREGQKVEFEAFFDPEKKKFKAKRVTGIGGKPLPAKKKRKTATQIAEERKKAKADKIAQQEGPLTDERKAAIKKQVLYYMSDINLSKDAWMREIIESSKEKNFISFDMLLKCNQLKTLTSSIDNIIISLGELDGKEFSISEEKGKKGIVRVNKLPEFRRALIMTITEISDDHTWKDIRDAIEKVHKTSVRVSLDTPVDNKSINIMCVDCDEKAVADILVKDGVISSDGDKIATCTLITDEAEADKYFNATKKNPKTSTTGNDNKRKRKASTPAVFNPLTIDNIVYAKGRNEVFDMVRGILSKYADKEELKDADHKFIYALLQNHPNASKKLANLKSIIVQPSEHSVNDVKTRCFHVVHTNGDVEDISFIKALDKLSGVTSSSNSNKKQKL